MDNLIQDIRFAVRMLAKHPGYALIAIVTIALGIGANSVIFGVLNEALIRPLPYANANRLVYVGETGKSRPYPGQLSYPDYLDLKQNNHSLESVAAFTYQGVILTGYGDATVLTGARVTSSFLPLLGVKLGMGRNFTAEEESGTGAPAVILTDKLWRSKFQSNPQMVGRTLRLGDQAYNVVGVLPPDFYFAKTSMAELYFALRPDQREQERRYFHWMSAIGQAKAGLSVEQVNADLGTLAAAFGVADPKWHRDIGLGAVGLQRDIVGKYQPILLMLMTAVGFVLLIACANVANLMLARTNGRQKEIATRAALGATRWDIARLLLAESIVLAVVGAILGVVWANWGSRLLVNAIPERVRESAPFLQASFLDFNVVLFAAGLSIIAGLLFGALPAMRFSRTDVNSALKSAGITTSGSRSFAYDALMVGEVSLALMLLVGAGLLTVSLNRLLQADPGFDRHNLVTAQVTVPPTYETNDDVLRFNRALLEKVRSLPGVERASSTDALPLIGAGGTGTPVVVGRAAPAGRDYEAQLREVSSQYFETMRIPLVSGRTFEERDVAERKNTVIINCQLATDLFGADDPVDRKVKFVFTGDTEWQIVGVVGNESVRSLDVPNQPVLYFRYGADRGLNMVVRTEDETTTKGAIRNAIASLDPNVPVQEIRSMDEVVEASPLTFVHKYPAILLSGFGALALVLAMVGIYGVVAYGVSQRTREIGIRIALGAQSRHVLDAVLRRNLLLTTAGLALGVLGTFALGRFLQGLLFGVRSSDPMILAAGVAILAAVALLASYIPARRATLVDPMSSLREQ